MGIIAGFHAHIVFHTCHLGDISEFGRIDQHTSLDVFKFAVSVTHSGDPASVVSAYSNEYDIVLGLEILHLFQNHVAEHALTYMGLEKHTTDPTGMKRLETAVLIGEISQEFAPKSALHVVIAIGSRDAG